MSDEIIDFPELPGYLSMKEAARMLGIAYTTLHGHVMEGRIKAMRVGGATVIPVEEVKKFKPNVTGRPRTTVPIWRIAPEDNLLFQVSIFVRVRRGKQKAFRERLEEIRAEKEHLFAGTVARYIMTSEKEPDLVQITLIWRSSVMPEKETRELALEAFRQTLDEVLDWGTARYDEGTIVMHA
ncbi:MAG TPA: helix-turn-helix domain-containing protein [Ktedonosporobacter sp.]|nr:helix-turn-helix domain-containing protein [Ktedonosporobacter sp.]